VLAALDNSPAAQPVLATAVAFGDLFDAEVEALHVRTEADGLAARLTERAGLPLSEFVGPVAQRLLEAASADDVALLVVGARRTPGGARPAGHTALDVATSLAKPVVVVPPDVRHPGRLRRVLVPLEGPLSASLAPQGVIELASRADLEVIALHVHDEASLPAFTDQPQHETDAWAREFLARYCPSGMGAMRLETRVGRCADLVPRAAEETDVDLVALGWAQELAPGRAPVVRAALEFAQVPVMLVPVIVGAVVPSGSWR
jgi:nucleotide-binding universal stress UspA family protein